jgi:hypothetical protein
LQKFTRSADDIYSLRVEGASEPLGVTSEHPFFVRVYRARDNLLASDDDGEWRETQQLQVGDEIKLANGSWAKVLEVEFKGSGEVYNFTVAGNHNYFVGDLGLLTHNAGCTPTNTGLGRSPKKSTPDSIYEQFDNNNNVRSRTFYDENGHPFSRQDFDHSHGGLQPHEHKMGFDASGRSIMKKIFGPVPSGY